MDLFRLDEVPSINTPDDGMAITKYDSLVWTERYRDAGDFKVTAQLSSDLRSQLPIGSFVSHTETYELMVVEDHYIREDPETDPVIEISGRSLETVLNQRAVGVDLARAGSLISEYEIGSATVAWQTQLLINDHISTPANAVDELPDLLAVAVVSSATSEPRVINKGPLYDEVVKLLAVDDVGIRSYRFNMHDPIAEGTRLLIHQGTDRSDAVKFSWKSGELKSAEYLWSDRERKNAALILGRYLQQIAVLPGTSPSGYERKYMIVDASDIDGHYEQAPTGSSLTWNLARMQTRGREALLKQNQVAITAAEVSNLTTYRFRRDYDIGDIVTLDGNFGEIREMRVTEYTEVNDENGETGYPTLSVLGGT